jgi:hypothetical protein
MKIYFSVVAFFAAFNLFSQEYSPQQTTENAIIETSTEGTYQLQVINSRGNPYFPANLDEIVRANRKKDEPAYVWLGSNVRLKILPLSEIKASGFARPEKIVYINE